ncbi:MAG: helix-turn-helix domain-containing protein [Bacteroidetes bacterium]|nr:helix-turn-helix domain-containing protein [Bacteroidota bacterium]
MSSEHDVVVLYPDSKGSKILRKEIGTAIMEIRRSKGYNQKQLAEVLGISRSTLSKIENGNFAISVDYLERISHALNFQIIIRKSGTE